MAKILSIGAKLKVSQLDMREMNDTYVFSIEQGNLVQGSQSPPPNATKPKEDQSYLLILISMGSYDVIEDVGVQKM